MNGKLTLAQMVSIQTEIRKLRFQRHKPPKTPVKPNWSPFVHTYDSTGKGGTVQAKIARVDWERIMVAARERKQTLAQIIHSLMEHL